jgi:translation initiation factor 1 (eIF-1/SUI1)
MSEGNCCHFAFEMRNGVKKIIKYFKKTFSCTGSIEKSEEFGEVIKLTGDQKRGFLIF